MRRLSFSRATASAFVSLVVVVLTLGACGAAEEESAQEEPAQDTSEALSAGTCKVLCSVAGTTLCRNVVTWTGCGTQTAGEACIKFCKRVSDGPPKCPQGTRWCPIDRNPNGRWACKRPQDC
jgi:hypothetical protein